ncbi:hypothetical protein EV702DRAFT_1051130 [Suillus placidus]|uniref:Uncharacterized protein n=1 Tax=Suillus placidus TaxID=48579 RepID=A0A9P7CW74_9AGAM|nr:hypothetical protein EV702DRAFT_1051130 [Suillus placidus]
MSTKPLDPPKYDLDSVTEPESELNIPLKPQTLPQVIQPLVCDLGSVTEPESELDVPLKHTPKKTVIQPLICDLSSVTEPESDLDIPPKPQTLLQVIQPLVCDPDSITEPESDLDVPPKHTPKKTVIQSNPDSVIKPKRKSFFKTPSPPPPGSIYWNYVSHEEDARWYDRTGTDNSFEGVHKMKRCLTT